MKWQHWLVPIGQYKTLIIAVKSQFVSLLSCAQVAIAKNRESPDFFALNISATLSGQDRRRTWRRFATFLERISRPERESRLFLKNKSRTISFCVGSRYSICRNSDIVCSPATNNGLET